MVQGALAASLLGALIVLSGCASAPTQPYRSGSYEDADDTCGGDIAVAQAPWVVSDSDCGKAH